LKFKSVEHIDAKTKATKYGRRWLSWGRGYRVGYIGFSNIHLKY
jgi:hypothetical protein